MKAKSKIIFIIGIEGSGHNATYALLDNFFKLNNVDFIGESWHKQLINIWSNIPDHSQKKFFYRQKYQNLNYVRDQLELIKHTMLEDSRNGIDFFVESASFPFDNPRVLTRSPDLFLFHHVFSEDFEMKYIFLKRDITEAIKSNIRREFTENAYEQMQISIWNQSYINYFKDFLRIPTLNLSYRQLIKNPELVAENLSSFLDVKISPAINLLHMPTAKSSKINALGEEINKILNSVSESKN